jgi:hypothetical protein
MIVANDYATLLMALGIAALTFLMWALVARKIVHRQFWCPWKKASMDVDFLASRFRGKYVDVLSCSAFSKDAVVDCGKRCVNVILPERMQLKRGPRNRKTEGLRVESKREVRRWLF